MTFSFCILKISELSSTIDTDNTLQCSAIHQVQSASSYVSCVCVISTYITTFILCSQQIQALKKIKVIMMMMKRLLKIICLRLIIYYLYAGGKLLKVRGATLLN